MTLFLSITVWAVVLYSVRIAVWGEPVYNLIARSDPEQVRRAEALMQTRVENPSIHDTAAIELLRKFSHLTLLGLAMFILEMAILIYLMVAGRMFWLSFGLFVKNLAALVVSLYAARVTGHGKSLLAAVREMPATLVLLDRFSATLSAAGFLWIFLTVNQLVLRG